MSRSEKDRNQDPLSQHHENQFVIFRHFTDQVLATLMKSFTTLPTALNSSGREGRWDEYHSDRPRRRSRAAESESAVDSQFQKQSEENAARKTDGSHLAEAQEEDANRPPQRSLFHHTPLSLSLLRLLLEPNDTISRSPVPLLPMGLAEYLCASPYSPLHLSTDVGSSHALNWKAAFEDLLDAEVGRPMDSKTRSDHLHDWTWVFAMVRKAEGAATARLTLADVLAQHRGFGMCRQEDDASGSKQQANNSGYGNEDDDDDENEDEEDYEDEAEDDEEEKDSDACTELDLYRKYADMDSSSESPSKGTRPSAFSQVTADHSDLGLLSSLTTMERTVLPNGMVRTKMTLKKRFADGSEQCSESVETTRRDSVGQPASSSKINSEAKETAEQDSRNLGGKTAKTTKGWFWS